MKRVYFSIVVSIILLAVIFRFMWESYEITREIENQVFSLQYIEDGNEREKIHRNLMNNWASNDIRWFIIFGKSGVFELKMILGELEDALQESYDTEDIAEEFSNKLGELWYYQRVIPENLL